LKTSSDGTDVLAEEYIAFLQTEPAMADKVTGMHWKWCKFSIREILVKPHDGDEIALIDSSEE
jgi:hypothetical protein